MLFGQDGAAYPLWRSSGSMPAGDEVRLWEWHGGSTTSQAGGQPGYKRCWHQLPRRLRLCRPTSIPPRHRHRSRPLWPRSLSRPGHESAGLGRWISWKHWQFHRQREYFTTCGLSWRFASSHKPCFILDTQMISPFQELREGKILGCYSGLKKFNWAVPTNFKHINMVYVI